MKWQIIGFCQQTSALLDPCRSSHVDKCDLDSCGCWLCPITSAREEVGSRWSPSVLHREPTSSRRLYSPCPRRPSSFVGFRRAPDLYPHFWQNDWGCGDGCCSSDVTVFSTYSGDGEHSHSIRSYCRTCLCMLPGPLSLAECHRSTDEWRSSTRCCVDRGLGSKSSGHTYYSPLIDLNGSNHNWLYIDQFGQSFHINWHFCEIFWTVTTRSKSAK